MQKRAPTLANLLVILLFALSCFGLLLFLWESFGGPIPLKPKGYRFTVAFTRTLSLAEQADVRISGVEVGHVISMKVDKDGRTHVTVEIASKYAPLHKSDHVILRLKTLLGETYVQVIPGSRSAPVLHDGEQLPNSQVEPSVTLDDILATFSPEVRQAFHVWTQSLAKSINGRGESINAFLAEFNPFVEHANRLVAILASQEGALTGVVKGTGEVFDALTERQGELSGLLSNGERAFSAAAQNGQAFADGFKELPAFERNGTSALRSIDRFAADANPLLDQLRPVERQLSALVEQTKGFTPPFNSFLTGLGPLTKAAKTGLPDIQKQLSLTEPLLENAIPVLRNLDPFLQFAGEYVPELQSFFANLSAATQAHDVNKNDPTGPQEHYLRTMLTLNPEALAIYPQRTGNNRANPYFQPGSFANLANGLQVYSNSSCADSAPSVNPKDSSGNVPQKIIEQLIAVKVVNSTESTSNQVGAPACNQQGPFTFNGQTGQFPHATPATK